MMRDAAPPVGNIMKLVFASHNIGWKERKAKRIGLAMYLIIPLCFLLYSKTLEQYLQANGLPVYKSVEGRVVADLGPIGPGFHLPHHIFWE